MNFAGPHASLADFRNLLDEAPDQAAAYLINRISFLEEKNLLHCALMLKELGHLELSKLVFSELLSQLPQSAAVLYEAAIIEIKLEYLEKALSLLERALMLAPTFLNAMRYKVVVLMLLGRDWEAVPFVRQSIALMGYTDELGELAAFAESSNHWLDIYQSQKSSGRSGISVATLAKEIIDSVRSERPYSFLRLGDGEGAFLIPRNGSYSLRILGENARRYFAQRWYGSVDAGILERLTALASELPGVISRGSTVGCPQQSWCKHEVESANIRSVSCCLSAAQAGLSYSKQSTTASANIDLAFAGHLSKIVNLAPSITIISCHSEIFRIFKGIFKREKDIDFIEIPPAASDLSVTTLKIYKPHLEQFEFINQRISNYVTPRLFLVGAGFLGKFYVDYAALRGNVAVDVGSVFDAILGFSTRPNFEGINLGKRFFDTLGEDIL